MPTAPPWWAGSSSFACDGLTSLRSVRLQNSLRSFCAASCTTGTCGPDERARSSPRHDETGTPAGVPVVVEVADFS